MRAGFSEHSLYSIPQIEKALKEKGILGKEPLGDFLKKVEPEIPLNLQGDLAGGRALPYLLSMWSKRVPPVKPLYVKTVEDVLRGPAWPEVMAIIEVIVTLPPFAKEDKALPSPKEEGSAKDKGEERSESRKRQKRAHELEASPVLDDFFQKIDTLDKRLKNLEEFIMEDLLSMARKVAKAEVAKGGESLGESLGEVRKEVGVWKEHVRYANDTLHRFSTQLERVEREIKELERKIASIEEALQKVRDRIAGFIR